MTTQHLRGPGTLTRADATDLQGLGSQWTDGATGKRYVYCYNGGGTSWTVGVPIGVFLTTPTYGMCSFTAATQLLYDSGTTAATLVAGVGLGTVATTEFGWIQVGGVATVATDTNCSIGLAIYCADNGITFIPGIDTSTHANAGTMSVGDDGTASGTAILTNCAYDF